ncbi:MAG TPA: mannose-1-phosphate guanylyltransferase/mannose-6-phosphate isomerase [Desulfovibrio sp.]|jgi:mannose-1-phosphate guanylyltransferase/mannose-6-phosphate isomerase|nr:mannose-1-phosphate guanylyltransferase/mannose-6-phosphate isomerase [Desulfovibrio sp.]
MTISPANLTATVAHSPADAAAAALGRCHAIILAGGSGTRLWPLSRALFPKQLLALNGDLSLLQQTVRRVLSLFPPERVHIVTNEEHVFEVRAQARALDERLDSQVLAEPVGRNTLPAILLGLDAALRHAGAAGSDAPNGAQADDAPLLAVFPSDHLLHDEGRWRAAVTRGAGLAAEGWSVTFGVPPTTPETGYGYIRRGAPLAAPDAAAKGAAFAVDGFVEKPDLETARGFLRQGMHFWNSGMFVFNGGVLLAAVQRFQPALAAWWATRQDTPLAPAIPLAHGYSTLPSISIDYGIMEHVDRIAVVEADFGWDDLGSWEALYRLGAKDERGCVVQGDTLAMDCDDCLLLSRGGKLVAIGLSGVIAVQTRDATLICAMDQVQRVKDVVERLKAEKSPLVDVHLTVRRPWGNYTVLDEGPGRKVKRIEVNPGARLSLQMHHHRSEHWVVAKGAALVQVGNEERTLTENEWVDIPKATLHRLTNPGRIPLELIEIQSGPYLGEDDIVRFDDVYGRRKEG